MLDIFPVIAPVFLLIVLGNLLRRRGIPGGDFWNLNDRLVFWVLIPALLFAKISTSGIALGQLGGFSAALVAGFAAATVYALVVVRLLPIDGPACSSVLQGAARNNIFIAFAVVERLYGPEALTLAVLGAALIVPITNLTIVPLMVTFNDAGERGRRSRVMMREIGSNPILWSVGLGLLASALHPQPIPVVHETADLLGRAALPAVLLSIGANLRIRAMTAAPLPILAAVVGKYVVWPATVLVLALVLGLPRLETLVLVTLAAQPTAASAYALAREMGGDAPLMAGITTLQTALAFLSLPVTIVLVEALLSG